MFSAEFEVTIEFVNLINFASSEAPSFIVASASSFALEFVYVGCCLKSKVGLTFVETAQEVFVGLDVACLAELAWSELLTSQSWVKCFVSVVERLEQLAVCVSSEISVIKGQFA